MKKTPFAAALAVAAIALTACSPGGGSAAAGTAPTELKIGNFLDVTAWDPANADIGFDGPYLSAVYDPLVALNGNGEPIPALATGWKFSGDRKTLTMDLRTDAKFSDGEAFNAEAAVANLEHLKEGARSGEAYQNVKKFTAVDEDTIQFAFAERENSILYFMGLGRSYMASPAALASGALQGGPVGSGPYALDASSTPGSEYVFTKTADHWDAATYPFETVKVLPITDATARHNAMLSGQINVEYGDPANIPQAEQSGWNVANKVSGWVGIQFVDRTGKVLEPLGDERVRQALNYAFDGAAILESIGSGAGTATDQVFPAGTEANDPKLDEVYSYNVDEAKRLLTDAGYADGFSVTMPMSPVFQTWQAAAEQALTEIGVKVTWDDMSQPDYQAKAATYPMFISFLAMDADPVATVARQLTSKQWFNPNTEYTEIPELKALVDKIKVAEDSEQLALIKELNKALTEQAWWTVWYQSDNTYFSADGITVTPVTGMMFPTLRHIQQG
ncbi:ABC transporter substrate-binding protein [Arthrobacter ginkgonis]|uniref:ABC transporter substrate-binding protein n=1 Tax=Arthrobacter ginkgonis TaxID=1630594 RepID=A0ABP7CZK7_9MICC